MPRFLRRLLDRWMSAEGIGSRLAHLGTTCGGTSPMSGASAPPRRVMALNKLLAVILNKAKFGFLSSEIARYDSCRKLGRRQIAASKLRDI